MVAVGYDERNIIFNSGKEEHKIISREAFLKTWGKTKFWTLRITPHEEKDFPFSPCSMLHGLFSGLFLSRVIILKDPLTAEEHLNLGVTYEQQGDLDNAIKEYDLAAKKLPAAFLYLGMLFPEEGMEKSGRLLRLAIEKDPENADATTTWHGCITLGGKNWPRPRGWPESPGAEPGERDIYRDTLERSGK